MMLAVDVVDHLLIIYTHGVDGDNDEIDTRCWQTAHAMSRLQVVRSIYVLRNVRKYNNIVVVLFLASYPNLGPTQATNHQRIL